MTPKLLSAEDLRRHFKRRHAAEQPTWVDADAIAAHIAALEAERDTWRQCAEERQQAAQQQMNDKHALEAGHARALVRAKNEGLEKAADAIEHVDAFITVPLDGSTIAATIRAMKEPES